ncbi:MAG: STAS domain-containing protein [bacterium]
MDFEIKQRNANDVVILDISGNLDSRSAPLLKVRLESLISFGHNKIVLNLSDVDFIDSTGVGSLIYGQKIVNPVVGGIHIIGLSQQNLNIFSVLNLTEVFSIMATEDVAVGSFHQDGSTIH